MVSGYGRCKSIRKGQVSWCLLLFYRSSTVFPLCLGGGSAVAAAHYPTLMRHGLPLIQLNGVAVACTSRHSIPNRVLPNSLLRAHRTRFGCCWNAGQHVSSPYALSFPSLPCIRPRLHLSSRADVLRHRRQCQVAAHVLVLVPVDRPVKVRLLIRRLHHLPLDLTLSLEELL